MNMYADTIEKMVQNLNAVVMEGPWGNSAKDKSKTVVFPFRDGEILVWCVDRFAFGGMLDQQVNGWYKTESNTQKALKLDSDEFMERAGDKDYWDRRVDSCTRCDKHVPYEDLNFVLFAGRECDECFDPEKNNINID